MTISPSASTTSMVEAKPDPIVAGMAGVSLQCSKSESPPVYDSVKDEESATHPNANDEDAELQLFLEIFRNAKGETFARLFDLLERRFDQDEGLIRRQINALPVSGLERKAQLAIELLDLRMERSLLQSQKKTYLANPETQETIREDVLLKIMDLTQSRDVAQIYDPSALLVDTGLQDLKQAYAEEREWAEKQKVYWRSKAEEARKAIERRRFEGEDLRRKKFAEDTANRRRKYEDDMAKLQMQMEDEQAQWRKQFEEEQAQWLKKDREEYAKWQKEEEEDMARWQKQDAEYLVKQQKKDAEALAKWRIKNAENLAKSRAREAKGQARLEVQGIENRNGSSEKRTTSDTKGI